ncbi:MAG: hypothetical protein IJ058_10080 [Lachnospiraceae bacterium]|nr:hypothetical protein [Lachnospiraceae bacterium]
MNNELIVGGYIFGTAADADLAREEQARIKYLDENMNYANIAKVQQLYNRALDTKMFRTPVGWDYLSRLKRLMTDNGFSEELIRPVPLYNVFAKEEEPVRMIDRIKPPKKKKDIYRRKYVLSVMCIGVLAILVIVMFVIAIRAETPNMINYRHAIVNDYAEWEQNIKDREDRVRKKERELELVSPPPHELNTEDLLDELENRDEQDTGS